MGVLHMNFIIMGALPVFMGEGLFQVGQEEVIANR
jgi:hypothetical protein